MKQRFTNLFRSMRYAMLVVALFGVCQQSMAKYYSSDELSGTKYTVTNGLVIDGTNLIGYTDGIGASVSVPSIVTRIRNNCFESCKTIKTITFNSAVLIQRRAFMGSTLESISLNGISLTLEALCGAKSLKTVDFTGYVAGSDETDRFNENYIPEDAFYGCSSLTSINTRDVTRIGDRAFGKCSGLTTVKMPNVKSIDYHAFEFDTNLSSISMSVVDWVSEGAFTGCRALKRISLPQSLTQMERFAFGTETPKIITIEGVKWFNKIENVYQIFGNVESIYFDIKTDTPETLEIPANFAMNLRSLESITFAGTKPVRIRDNAFSGCTNLASVVGSAKVNMIGANAFYNTGLTSITLQSCTVDATSFAGCSSLTSLTLNNMGYSGWSFKGNEYITTLNLEKCSDIPREAFRGCHNLSRVTSTGASVSVGEYAFAECTSLNDVVFSNLTAIGEGGFKGCSAFEDFGTSTLALTRVGNRAFEDCTNMNGYINLSSCTMVGEYVFNNAGTEDLHITISLTPCLSNTLSGCRAGYLTCNDTRLWNSYTATGNQSPLNGSHFQIVELPEMTSALPTYIFHNMPELQAVKMPKLTDATNLNKNFGFCPALSSLDIANSKLRYYGGGVYSNDFKTLYYILPSYTSFQAHLSVTKVYADCADQPSYYGSTSRLSILDLSLCGPVELYNPKGTFNSPSHYVRIPYGKRNDYKTFTAAGMEFITDYIKGDVNEDSSVTNADAQGVYIEMDNAE